MKNMTIILAAAVTLLFATGCVKNTADQSFNEFAFGKKQAVNLPADQLLRVAHRHLERGKAGEAYELMAQALQQKPGDPDILAFKGEIYAEQGQDEAALNQFLAVLRDHPDHARACQGAGVVYFRSGLMQEAETYLHKAVAGDPTLWMAHNYLGVLHDSRGEYNQAQQSFMTALDLHKGGHLADILNNLGVVQMAMGQYREAGEWFRQALEQGATTPRTYNNLGLALARTGRSVEALEAFRYGGGSEARAHNNLGFVLLSDGHAKDAIPHFERALELSPTYYAKAAENLKRARMASRFASISQSTGSTPNQLSPASFPSEGQVVGAAVEVPATETAAPSAAAPEKVASALAEADAGKGNDIEKTYGIHVSSWRDMNGAKKYCTTLSAQGYKTWINNTRVANGDLWHRILVGRYRSVEQAEQARPEILKKFGFEHASIYELKSEDGPVAD